MAWKSYDYTPLVSKRGGIGYAYRPLLEIYLAGPKMSGTFEGLVDSGSDITMIDYEIAEMLGIDLTKAEAGIASGIGAGKEKGFIAEVTMTTAEFEEKIVGNVVFVKSLGFDMILGQQDFFRRFNVKFQMYEKKFYLELAPTEDEGK